MSLGLPAHPRRSADLLPRRSADPGSRHGCAALSGGCSRRLAPAILPRQSSLSCQYIRQLYFWHVI